MSADPYVYPGTQVLRNAQGIRDPDLLRQVEADLTRTRAVRIAAQPIPGAYDLAHLQHFHHALFEGLYEWAGELRTVPIAKADMFCLPQYLEPSGRGVFDELARDQHLHGLGRDAFVGRLAHHLANVNALHPFREGNGRTQRAFFSQMAADAGYELHWQQIDAERNNVAAIAATRGDVQPLRDILDDITASSLER